MKDKAHTLWVKEILLPHLEEITQNLETAGIDKSKELGQRLSKLRNTDDEDDLLKGISNILSNLTLALSQAEYQAVQRSYESGISEIKTLLEKFISTKREGKCLQVAETDTLKDLLENILKSCFLQEHIRVDISATASLDESSKSSIQQIISTNRDVISELHNRRCPLIQFNDTAKAIITEAIIFFVFLLSIISFTYNLPQTLGARAFLLSKTLNEPAPEKIFKNVYDLASKGSENEARRIIRKKEASIRQRQRYMRKLRREFRGEEIIKDFVPYSINKRQDTVYLKIMNIKSGKTQECRFVDGNLENNSK